MTNELIPRSVGLSENGDRVRIIDQSRLPNELVYLELEELPELTEAIVALRVRGAPAIGIFAGCALCVLAKKINSPEPEAFMTRLAEAAETLKRSRPTAVNLAWAADRMLRTARENAALPRAALLKRLYEEADAIYAEDVSMCRAIAENGLSLIRDGDGILTHCNAGPLATSRYGTALGPMLLGREMGLNFHVFADETRPLLQGARLTSWELSRAGVDVTLICDNMASSVMKKGWVQAVFVGCDRVAANGDAANKIGTSGLAILAKHYGIPFYVFGPSSTLDLDCPTGDDIVIEERPGSEIKELWYEKPMAPADVRCYNPAFDVTDHRLITGIVTENGIFRPPFDRLG